MEWMKAKQVVITCPVDVRLARRGWPSHKFVTLDGQDNTILNDGASSTRVRLNVDEKSATDWIVF